MSQALQLWANKAGLLSHTLKWGCCGCPPSHTSASAPCTHGRMPGIPSSLGLWARAVIYWPAAFRVTSPKLLSTCSRSQRFQALCLGGTTQDVFAADVCSCGLFLTASQILITLVLEETNTAKAVTLAYVCLLNESWWNLHPSVNLPGPTTTHQNLHVATSSRAQSSGWKPGMFVLVVWEFICSLEGVVSSPKPATNTTGYQRAALLGQRCSNKISYPEKKDLVISKYKLKLCKSQYWE